MIAPGVALVTGDDGIADGSEFYSADSEPSRDRFR
jgi:hypothetical protein